MAKYKACNYDQLVMVPVNLEDQLVPGTLEHTIHYVVEQRMDLSGFDGEYRNESTGRTAYNPRVLLKVVLLGYARGLLSSRRMERACRENILFMALTCGQQPDHSTLAGFVSGMGLERVQELFTQVLLVCNEAGLLGGTHFSLDGLKLPGNASKEWSGTHADLGKKAAKLRELVKTSVKEHTRNDRSGAEDAGRQRQRAERLKEKAERVEAFLAAHKPKLGRRGTEVQSNVTDNDSARMKSAHGVIQGYNAQAVVDAKAQVVVCAEPFGEADDAVAAGPMLEGTAQALKAIGRGAKALTGQTFSADTGYYSVANLESCEKHALDAYIPDRAFRSRDPRFAEAQRHRRPTDRHKQQYKSQRRWFGPDDFTFDAATQKLVCPAGTSLYRNGVNFKSQSGHLATTYRAPEGACAGCPLRARCLRNPNGSSRTVRLFRGRLPGSLTEAMKAKIDTPEGRAIYSRRLANVEPVFANVRHQKRLDRFTLRGRPKVSIQWKLYCMVHNLEKIGHGGLGLN